MEAQTNDLAKVQQQVKDLEAEKYKFYEIVSLWLGSPLNSLKMLSQMLAADVAKAENPALDTMAKHVQAQVDKLHQLMQNLIQWSSVQVGNVHFAEAAVPLHALAATLSAKFAAQAEKKGIQLHCEVEPDLRVQGDKNFLTTILENLLSNSLKFSRKGDRVSFTAHREGDRVKLVVTDTGIGMGKAKMAKIFEVGRRSAQKGTANEDGLGLGMIVIKALLAFHQAELALESKQGEGTTASFVLPAAAE